LELAAVLAEEPAGPLVSVAVAQAELQAVVAVEAGLLAAAAAVQGEPRAVAPGEPDAVLGVGLLLAAVLAAQAVALGEPQDGSAEQDAGLRAAVAVVEEPGDFPRLGVVRAQVCFPLRGAAPRDAAEPPVALPDLDEPLPDGPQEPRVALRSQDAPQQRGPVLHGPAAASGLAWEPVRCGRSPTGGPVPVLPDVRD
jgi:hypothetical protein